MYRFIKNCFLLFVIVVLVSFLLFFAFLAILDYSYKDLPDSAISASAYFNGKVALLRNRQADIIGIGSSVTDTNLDPKMIIDEFATKSFFNISAGGITHKSIYEFIHIYNDVHKIKKLLIIGTINDYSHDGFHPDFGRLKKYLSRIETVYNQISLASLRLPYFISIRDCKKSMKDTINSNFARPASFFDFYGAGLIKKTFINLEQKKENKRVFDEDWNFFLHYKNVCNYNLRYLDSISFFCKKIILNYIMFNHR